MPAVSILVADDIMPQSAKARKRSLDLRKIAARFAQILKADIHYLYVEDIPERLRKGDRIKGLEKRNPPLVSRIRKELDSTRPGSELHIDRGNPILKTLEWEKKLSPEMVLLGTRGHKGLSKFFLGSVAEELLRRSSLPILILGPRYEAARFPADSGRDLRILVLSDLTSASSRAESYAIKLAGKMKARITLMHSVGDSIMRLRHLHAQSRIPLFPLEKEIQQMTDYARSQLKKKADRLSQNGLKVQAKLSLQERELADDLHEVLADDYDLVIMGTHGRNRLLTAFLGSNSRKTCLLSPIPVIILPSQT